MDITDVQKKTTSTSFGLKHIMNRYINEFSKEAAQNGVKLNIRQMTHNARGIWPNLLYRIHPRIIKLIDRGNPLR